MASLSTVQKIQSNNHMACAMNPASLANILKPHINLAIWQRSLCAKTNGYALHLQATTWLQQRVLIAPQDIPEYFASGLPDAPGKASFIADIALLGDMYSCLFDLEKIGIRLARLTTAMCPKFHTDKLGGRLITTYAGVGSEWLRNEDVWRNQSNHVMHSTSASIQQLATHDVAILKGDGWLGNEHSGIVHRSPALEHEQARVVLTIDGF